MKVKEVMANKCAHIDPNTTIQEVAKIMRDKDVGILAVGENDRLVGMITDRDMIIRALASGKDIKETKVKDVMTKKCLYCFEEDTLEETSKNMAKNNVRRLVVLNKDKRFVGMV